MSIYQFVTDMHNMNANGQSLEIINKYYADDAVLVEDASNIYGQKKEIKGRAEILQYEQDFFAGITEMKEFRIAEFVVSGDKAFEVIYFEATHKERGEMKMSEVAISTWENGKIVKVEYYYNQSE